MGLHRRYRQQGQFAQITVRLLAAVVREGSRTLADHLTAPETNSGRELVTTAVL